MSAFIELYLNGDATVEQIDDWIDTWHDRPNQDTGAPSYSRTPSTSAAAGGVVIHAFTRVLPSRRMASTVRRMKPTPTDGRRRPRILVATLLAALIASLGLVAASPSPAAAANVADCTKRGKVICLYTGANYTGTMIFRHQNAGTTPIRLKGTGVGNKVRSVVNNTDYRWWLINKQDCTTADGIFEVPANWSYNLGFFGWNDKVSCLRRM